MHPITMQEAEEMGAPACFSDEYAYYERNGMPLPYGGPVYPDHNREDVDWPEYTEPAAPAPCQGPPPTFAFLGMPPAWHPHHPSCWDHHPASATEACPPPF